MGPLYLRIDGHNSFAQPTATATEVTTKRMPTGAGAAIVAGHDAHHFSALWPSLEPWAYKGFIGLGMVTSWR
ncbi:hypothetical protein [Cutibacterium sp. V947]|uniref:hypothetical protein n=1 Tax=unclassified Cutibacterium TaxID=2649671 RepID=UPI003EE1C354